LKAGEQMAVRDVISFQPKPGRVPEIAALMKEGNEVADQIGVPQARLFNTAVGGEDFLTRVVVIEYENFEAWAQATTKQNASPEWRTLLPKIFGADAPWTVVSRNLLNEVEGV
jgi:hypothetical protein